MPATNVTADVLIERVEPPHALVSIGGNATARALVVYLGAIGSRERVSRMLRDLSPPIVGLHAPAGLDIGSETPPEIALAIAAEIIAVHNGRNGGPLCDGDGALHP